MNTKFIVVDNKVGVVQSFEDESKAKNMVATMQANNPKDNPDKDECYRHVYETHDDKCSSKCYCKSLLRR